MVATTDSKSSSKNYMNVRFKGAIDAQFRSYCETVSISMNGAINEVIKRFFELQEPNQLERLKRLSLAIYVFNHLDWARLTDALSIVKQNPLSKNAKMQDLLLMLFSNGLDDYMSSHTKNQ